MTIRASQCAKERDGSKRQRREGRDEALLRHVQRGIVIPAVMAREPERRRAVAVHQHAIGRLPPGKRLRGQFRPSAMAARSGISAAWLSAP
jgi:hypothetical protein